MITSKVPAAYASCVAEKTQFWFGLLEFEGAKTS
jgi:hypothetical protein